MYIVRIINCLYLKILNVLSVVGYSASIGIPVTGIIRIQVQLIFFIDRVSLIN